MTIPGPASPTVVAVVVAYGKTAPQLLPLLSAVNGQVTQVVLVDNSEPSGSLNESSLLAQFPTLHVIINRANLGVARAQNQGVARALEQGADFILLLDDDSMPAADMVARLMDAWRSAAAQGRKIAAAAPNFRDVGSGQWAIFPVLHRFGIARRRCAGQPMIVCDYLTASGMLISREVWLAVGVMGEALFIDYVDTDWCLRAWSQGYRFIGVCNASMEHQFGGSARAINLWGGRRIPYRAATRLYYMYRNAVLLLRQDYCPLVWKLRELPRLAVSAGLLVGRGPERMLRLKMILLGLNHGIRGIGGRMPVNADAG